VRAGTKLFKIIDEQGFELDLKSQIDKQIKDFSSHETYPLLEKYKNYLGESCFSLLKSTQTKTNTRTEFVATHRDLYRRIESELMQKLDTDLEMLKQPEHVNEESSEDVQIEIVESNSPREMEVKDEDMEMKDEDSAESGDQTKEKSTRIRQSRATFTNYKVLNTKGRDMDDESQTDADLTRGKQTVQDSYIS